MKNTIPWLLLALLATLPASAAELRGVTMDDTVTQGDHTLQLVGMGVRSAYGFKVYVGGLWMEEPSSDAAVVISSPQARRIEMAMLMKLPSDKIGGSVMEGFQRNSSVAQIAALRDRLATMLSWFPAVGKGDRITLTFVPGEGTHVLAAGEYKGLIPGDDFGEALMRVWFGDDPVDGNLMEGMLGL